jgi:hypothetical protein
MAQPCRILLFSPHGRSPRLEYIVQTLFREFAGLDPAITTSEEEFRQFAEAKIGYGGVPDGINPFIPACGLLFETGTEAARPYFEDKGGMQVLFPTALTDAFIPFDLFAASFWLLSRYEEYQSFTADKHGRFPSSKSLMQQSGLLEVPLVNLWLNHLLTKLTSVFPGFRPGSPVYTFIPTFDIDSAWAFRHKPFLRQLGGVVRSLLTGRTKSFIHRIRVLLHLEKDPFDTYPLIRSIHDRVEKPIFFMLVGARGRYNKNANPRNLQFRWLVYDLARFGRVALHPSYHAGDSARMLLSEKEVLERITGQPVSMSRQHFLRFRLPGTYRRLLNTGIQQDFSMGFADRPGFRAGACSPFRFYDLEKEESTPLQVYPVTVMDGTLRDYMNLTPKEATRIITHLSRVVRDLGGTFISLWHNESLGETGRWKGWSEVYRELVATGTASPGEEQQLSHQHQKNTP